MNKQEYMIELEKSLKTRKVADVEEILAEYEEHFQFKMADGYSEQEIAARLEQPAVIAEQFAAAGQTGGSRKAQKAFLATGLAFADIGACLFLILFFSWVLVAGAFTLAVSALGVCLIGGFNIAGLIPPMPYAASMVLGVSMAGLGVLSAVGTIYCWLYMAQLTKAYIRWHKNTLAGGVYPAVSKHPGMSGKCRRRLRGVTGVALIVFGVALIAGVLVLFIHTGFQPFWHALGWFQR